MKRGQKVRMALDAAMAIMLPLLMAYSLVGETAHEYLGIAMLLLFVGHHLRGTAWWKNVVKGRYTAVRILGVVVNLLLAAVMVALPISGIMMSRYAFPFLDWGVNAFYVRTIHLLAAYWGFALMSFHVGLRGKMILSMARRVFRVSATSKYRTLALRIAAGGISAYGVYVFIHRRLADYMFLKTQFAFFDFTESPVSFMVDHAFVMLLFAFVGYYLLQLLQKKSALLR
ncbi:MAG: DUF4405 domain-containing protein [Eggerthellaceae bacterium]|nr:DUF4405 domain-containing protein [Eggerthellaceae bacterium]